MERLNEWELNGAITKCRRMRELFAAVRRVAATSEPLLIQGERGVGKTWIAEAIHACAGRKGPLVSVACNASSEAFERGVFGREATRHDVEEIGAAERAEGGTLLFEAVDQLRHDLQGKLLRFVETHQVRRVGGRKAFTVDVRLLATTSRADMASPVARGDFRSDLYFRLNVFTLNVPPLRERTSDLPLLVDAHGLSAAAMVAIESYPWPGNLHELFAAIAEAKALAGPNRIIDLQHLPARIRDEASRGAAKVTRLTFKDAKDQLVSRFERAYIASVLSRCRGNASRAARESGLHRRSVTRLARKYQLRS